MKKKISRIILLISYVFTMSSCAVVLESLHYLSDQGLKYMDNCDRNNYEAWKQTHPDAKDSDYKGYSFRKDGDMSGLIMAMEAIRSGDGGKALVGIKIAGNLIGKAGGLDMTTFNQVMDNSTNSLIADPNSKNSNTTNVIGALAHSAEELLYLAEDRRIRKEGEESDEYIQQILAEVYNPESPLYDPYFDCTYEVVTIREGKYGSRGAQVIKKRGYNCESFEELQQVAKEMMECVRLQDSILAEQRFAEYMENEYGLSMTYEEYSNLPDAEKPSIENFVFPSHKSVDEILNDTTPIDHLISSEEKTSDNVSLSSDMMKEKELEQLEHTTVNAYKINSHELSEANKSELDNAAKILSLNPEWSIEIRGHCCDLGDEQTNYNIGMLRAKEAKKYLIKNGVDESRISTISMGETQPLVANDTPAHRAQNRRVEIVIVK